MRIFKTRDGRHVQDGHPDAAFLAYADGDDPPPAVLAELGAKQRSKVADKQASKPADKGTSGLTVKRLPKRPPASGPGSGVDAWRQYVADVTAEPVESLAEMSRDELMKLAE